jgi:two-component system, chemotaxis family, chemotaxis protein CheY
MNGKDIKDGIFLVVDDEEFIRSLVKQLLIEMGAKEVLIAEDGQKAIDVLAQRGEGINCIISDFKMPNMTGVELLQAVRAGTAHVDRDLPFAMLTGYSDKFVLGLAMALDVDAFIAKPVSKTMLLSRIAPLLTGDRQELLPAKNYAKLGLSETVNDLENRVAMLEKIIREYVKVDRLPPDPDKATRSAVWTTKPTGPAPVETSEPDPASQAVAPEHENGPKPQSPADYEKAKVNAVAVTLETVPEGSKLATDVRTKEGNLVLAAGTRLNERILDKLHHINDMGEDFGILHIVE